MAEKTCSAVSAFAIALVTLGEPLPPVLGIGVMGAGGLLGFDVNLTTDSSTNKLWGQVLPFEFRICKQQIARPAPNIGLEHVEKFGECGKLF